MVTDNAANQLRAIRLSKHKSIGCVAHTIQLSIEDSLTECPAIKDVLHKCERIVKYFKKSNKAYKKLVDAQRQLGLKELKLLQNVKTRWNSEFYLLQRVFENKQALKLALTNYSHLPTLCAEEWLTIDELIDVLSPVEAATRLICGSSYSTISTVIPVIQSISDEIKSMVFKSKIILKFRANLIKSFDDRFDHIETHPLMNVATLLDPRFKKGS